MPPYKDAEVRRCNETMSLRISCPSHSQSRSLIGVVYRYGYLLDPLLYLDLTSVVYSKRSFSGKKKNMLDALYQNCSHKQRKPDGDAFLFVY